MWDPHLKKDIQELNKIQNRAARYVTNRYHNTSSVSSMIADLGWESLQSRRIKFKMCMAYNAFNNICSLPIHNYVQISETNIRNYHPYKVLMPHTRVDVYKYSFFPSFGIHWNYLPVNLVIVPTLNNFKEGLANIRF